MSVPIKSIVTDISSSVIAEVDIATGASLTGLTVIVTVSESVNSPSLTVNSKLSDPLKSWFGI